MALKVDKFEGKMNKGVVHRTLLDALLGINRKTQKGGPGKTMVPNEVGLLEKTIKALHDHLDSDSPALQIEAMEKVFKIIPMMMPKFAPPKPTNINILNQANGKQAVIEDKKSMKNISAYLSDRKKDMKTKLKELKEMDYKVPDDAPLSRDEEESEDDEGE